MIMNELNTNLIEAAKEKFPAKGQLANILMDTLYMGKSYLPEAAWRSPLYISGSSHYFKRTGDIPGQNCRS